MLTVSESVVQHKWYWYTTGGILFLLCLTSLVMILLSIFVSLLTENYSLLFGIPVGFIVGNITRVILEGMDFIPPSPGGTW